MIPDSWLPAYRLAGPLMVLGTTSGLVGARLYVSEPLAPQWLVR